MSKKTRYWYFQTIGWMLFLISENVPVLILRHKIILWVFGASIWATLSGFLLSLPMHKVLVKQEIGQKTDIKQLTRLLGLVVVFTFIWALVYNFPGLFGLLLGRGWSFSFYLLQASRYFVYFLSIYLVWALIYFTYHYFDRLHTQQVQLLEHEQAKNLLTIEKLESERKTAELQQKATELEMQALRAQMNPHFIFNSLGSINHFVLNNETGTASDYLTKFSRLIRMVLNNSERPLISLEEDIEMLQLYLDLEKLRFKNSFEYKIGYSDSMDPDTIFIAPMLLQPFVENAVWHGLMHKQANGHLEILLSVDKDILVCCIIDDGVGRKRAGELRTTTRERRKSMGLQITKQRLALLNEKSEGNVFYHVDDLVDENGTAAGTKVILKIRFQTNPTKEDKLI